MAYQTVNPFNGKLVETFPEHSDEQLEALLARAERCFQEHWRHTSFAERAGVVHKAASILDLPFRGVKNSGYGRELSDLGIGEFVNKKLIRVA